MRITLAELAQLLAGEVVGDAHTVVTGMAPLEQAQPGDLTFLAQRKHAIRLADSRATAVLVDRQIPVDRPAIRVAEPTLAFIRVLEDFFPVRHPSWGVDPLAIVAPDVILGARVNIGPYAVIGHGTRLGDDVTVYPGTFIDTACEIGDGCVLYANVSVYSQVHLGRGVIVHSGAVLGADGFGFHPTSDGTLYKIPQVGRVVIGDAVEIGANTCVDRATVGETVIEAGVKLDNLVQIGHNSTIGAYTVLAGQVGISGSVHIGARSRLGGQVGVADHVTMGDGVSVAAQAGVPYNLEAGATVYGSPALPGPTVKRMHFYSLRLGDLFEQVKQLQRRIEELEGRETPRETQL